MWCSFALSEYFLFNSASNNPCWPTCHQGQWVNLSHDDVMKWKDYPRYWPFVRVIHRSQVDSPHRGQLRGTLMLSLICPWTNGWINNRDAGDLRRHRAHYNVAVIRLCFQAHETWMVVPGRGSHMSAGTTMLWWSMVRSTCWRCGKYSRDKYLHTL